MDIINYFGLSKHLLLFITGLHDCLYLDGGAAVCAALCYTVGFPGTGTKRQLELISPLQSHKYRAAWETGHALIMLQHLGLLFLLREGSVDGGSRAEVIWSECRWAVHSLHLPSGLLTPSEAMEMGHCHQGTWLLGYLRCITWQGIFFCALL